MLERTEQRVKQLVVSADGSMGERPLEVVDRRLRPAGPAPAVQPPRNATLRIDPDDVPF